MIQRLYTQLFDVTAYSRQQERKRAHITYLTTAGIGVLFTLYAVFVPFRTPLNFEYHTYLYRALRPAAFPLFTLAIVSFYTLMLVTLFAVRGGNLRYVRLLPAAMIYIGGVSIAVQSNILHAQNAYLLIVAVIVAGLLDGERGLLIFTPLHFVVIVTAFIATYNNEVIHNLPTNTASAFVLLLFTSVAALGGLYAYQRMLQANQQEDEVQAASRRLQLARLTTRIVRSLSQVNELDSVLNKIVVDIRRDFPDMYHVQIFLTDGGGRNAQLVASTGEVGAKLLARQHSLPVGSLSVIGQVTQRQETIAAVVGKEDTVHRPNDLLPDTRLEVAVPLSIAGRNIGALDLQSRVTTVIDDSDLTTLQSIADTLAITIYNARLLEQTQQRLDENRQLVARMEASRQEVERLNRELTGDIWADYITGQGHRVNFDVDFANGALEDAQDLTDAIQSAIQRQEITRTVQNGVQVVAVPLRVRGEVIGALEFEVEGELAGEELDMLNEISERLGVAAENYRLYENSQRIAQREALVNEIGTRIQLANSVEATLTEAANSLQEVLNAKRVAIQLGTPTENGDTSPPHSPAS